NRLRHTASRLFDADKKLPQSDRRKFPQCMADALQHFADRASASTDRSEKSASSSRRSTGFGSDVSNSHNPAKEAVTNSTHSSTDAATSNRTGGDHSDRRSGDTANNNNPVNGITGSDCDASTCRDDTVATVHECENAGHTRPAAGKGTNATACANSEDTATSEDTASSSAIADTDSTGCGCAQHSHSTDAATSTGPGTDPANGCRSGARTGASIHSAAADTANNDNPVSGITDSDCDASTCRRDDKVATVHEHGDADSTNPATGSSTNAAASASSTDPGNAGSSDVGCGCAQHSHSTDDTASANSEDTSGGDGVSTDKNTGSNGASGGWVADITVLAHVDDTTGELIGELSDGSKLPAAVLEELSCNARWSGLVFDRAGDALWRSRSRRSVTDTQWQALLATYGGCFHCAAPAGMCQAHHITPYSQGGATSLDNLIMVCWNCHHKIHHHNWQIEKHSDGSHTLHPPDDTSTATQPRYGPACADDYPSKPKPPTRRRRRRSPSRPETTTSRARTEANHARSQAAAVANPAPAAAASKNRGQSRQQPARSQEDITRPDNTTNNAPNRERTAATQDRAAARSRDQTRPRARDPALW
ncbi:MAG: HNH endonuclease, partial [Acidimicrobiaceae bacterium]|nr:HNH endonuclease [Acidimicrobiaceae bacterium]